MIEKYRQYINQWPQLESYIANNKVDNYGVVCFIVNKIFEYNMMNDAFLDLDEKIHILNEEEIIPDEIILLLKKVISKDYKGQEGIEINLLEWFYNEYKNYEYVMNEYKDKVFKHYGNIEMEESICKGQINIDSKYKKEILINNKYTDDIQFKDNHLENNKNVIKRIIKLLKKFKLSGVKNEGE